MNRYWYNVLNSVGKKICGGMIRADDMDTAYDKTLKRYDITVKTEYYGEGSIMEGQVWRKNFVRNDRRVTLMIGKVL